MSRHAWLRRHQPTSTNRVRKRSKYSTNGGRCSTTRPDLKSQSPHGAIAHRARARFEADDGLVAGSVAERGNAPLFGLRSDLTRCPKSRIDHALDVDYIACPVLL